jgi:methylated-DNA-[protein]-cysteine S-methyltransferase
MNYWTTFDSPIGELYMAGDDETVTALYMDGQRYRPSHDATLVRDDARFAGEVAQFGEYFAGSRREFEIDVAFPGGSDFQRRVWRALLEIPYGETWSYGELSERVGEPATARSVGTANGRNPISLIVPCHRVIGADGSLTGYGGGLDRKRRLLDLEAGVLPLLETA